MAANHTPGEWEAQRGGELMPASERLIVSTLGFNASGIREIRTIARTFGHAGEAESLANADVIAAASDMLAALRAADEALVQFTAFESDARAIMGNTNFEIVLLRRTQIRAAIAKATGAATLAQTERKDV